METFFIEPIGVIRSEIKNREDAPLFYTDGAPNAFIEMIPAYTDGLDRMRVGDEIIVITWLHQAHRETLKVHPRGDSSNPDCPLRRACRDCKLAAFLASQS